MVVGFAWGRGPRRDRSRLLDSQQPDECLAPRFAGANSCRSRAGSTGAPAPAPVVHERAPSPASAPPAQEAAPSPAAPAVQQAATPPAPAPPPAPGAPPAPPVVQAAPAPLPAAPNPAPNAGQQAASPPALTPRPSASSAPPVVAQKPPSAPAAPVAEPPLPQPAPGREEQQVAGVFAPKNLAQLVGAWAYSEGDCDRLFQRRGGGWAFRQPVDKFAQAAIVELPKKILLPSATCRIDGASGADGALKVSAECEDSISYTPSKRDDRAPLPHRTHLQRDWRSRAGHNAEEMRAVTKHIKEGQHNVE